MASRLDIIEELKIDYEIPYITDRGEVIDNTIIQINEQREGVNIGYALKFPTEQKLEMLFPADGVDSLARMIKQIFEDLGISPLKTILQLWEYSPVNGLYSVEGRAPVNKQRDTVMIILTKTPFIYKFGYELVLWHQAMHARDRWEYRFPSNHPLVEVGEWLDVLWHFSIDGRLQERGMPHYSKTERLDEAVRLLEGLCPIEDIRSRVGRLCDELWGEEVTFAQLIEAGKGLGLEAPKGGHLENYTKITPGR